MLGFFLEKFVLPFGDWYFKTEFMKTLREYRKIPFRSKHELDELQKTKLNAIMKYAKEQVPYYQKLGIVLSGDALEDIKKFPIIHKSTLREVGKELVVGSLDGKDIICQKSSGSSGLQSEIFLTQREYLRGQAVQTSFWEWGGFRIGGKILQLGMSPKRSFMKRMKDIFLRTDYQLAYNISDEVVKKALLKNEKRKPDFFIGYASALYGYAQKAEEMGINGIKFKAVISLGDKMFPHYREKIEKVFHTKVFDTYGCTEGFMMASQCEMGNYHQISAQNYLELLDESGNPVPDGEPGFVVVTRLDAHKMPLIRFYLGDIAIRPKNPQPCACGRNFPLLEKIVGRDTDLVKTPSGKILIVHFFTGIWEYFQEIYQFRVIQHQLDRFEIEYIPDPSTFKPEVLSRIHQIMNEKAGEELMITFKMVDSIPATKSGKPQIILSTLEKSVSNNL
jgi:phenylacetate-CoA ligase